jgi:hypothetical protein
MFAIPHLLAALPPFATSPQHFKKGGKAAKKCGLGKHVVNFTLLTIFGSSFFGVDPAVNVCKTDVHACARALSLSVR